MSDTKPRFRDRRAEAARRAFAPEALFMAGLLAMPAFLFNPSLLLRVLLFFYFWFLAWAVGKKVNLLFMAIAILSIVFFNLLVPYGLVLYQLGPFSVTLGALTAGFERAITVEGLILLSRATIRADLRLPGTLGSLVGESFRYFERIMERKAGIQRKDPIGGIDRLMADLWSERAEVAAELNAAETPVRRGILGYMLLGGIALLAWSPWLLFLQA